MQYIRAMQEETSGKGELQINVTSTLDSHPIAEAKISISYTGVPERTLEQVTTDSSGQSEVLTLDAPPESWSLDPENERQPYSEYTPLIRKMRDSRIPNIHWTSVLRDMSR